MFSVFFVVKKKAIPPHRAISPFVFFVFFVVKKGHPARIAPFHAPGKKYRALEALAAN